jgi:hypothetical protein
MRTELIPFIGIECEGPYQGKQVLFIPRGFTTVAGLEIASKTILDTQVSNLYFGAGDRCGLDLLDIEIIRSLPENYFVIAEIAAFDELFDIPEDVRERIEIIYSINVKHIKFDHIKLVDAEKVWWCSLKHKYKWFTTMLNHFQYKQDKKLEL